MRRRALDGAAGELGFVGELEGFGAFFVGIGEDAEPVDFSFGDESAELGEVGFGFAGEAYDEGGADDDAGDYLARLLDQVEEDLRVAAALHGLEDRGAGVLEGDVEVFCDGVVACHGFEQARGDLVGVGVEEAEPAQAGERGEGVEELGEALFEAEVFAVAGGVLADEGDFTDALGDEVLRLGDDGAHAAGTELAAELGDDAEGTGVVAAFGDFDVGGGSGRGEDAWGGVGVEVVGEGGGGSVPGLAGETAGLFAGVAFGAEGYGFAGWLTALGAGLGRVGDVGVGGDSVNPGLRSETWGTQIGGCGGAGFGEGLEDAELGDYPELGAVRFGAGVLVDGGRGLGRRGFARGLRKAVRFANTHPTRDETPGWMGHPGSWLE